MTNGLNLWLDEVGAQVTDFPQVPPLPQQRERRENVAQPAGS